MLTWLYICKSNFIAIGWILKNFNMDTIKIKWLPFLEYTITDCLLVHSILSFLVSDWILKKFNMTAIKTKRLTYGWSLPEMFIKMQVSLRSLKKETILDCLVSLFKWNPVSVSVDNRYIRIDCFRIVTLKKLRKKYE